MKTPVEYPVKSITACGKWLRPNKCACLDNFVWAEKSHSIVMLKKIPNRTKTQIHFILIQSYLSIDENSCQATLKLLCFHLLVDCKGRIHIWCMHEVFLSMFPMFWYLRAVTIAEQLMVSQSSMHIFISNGRSGMVK